LKKRIQIDSSILSLAVLFTGVLYRFPTWYPANPVVDNIFDFVGMLLILKGTFLRMAARGHKKAHSGEGHGLVKTGLYAYVRNPMYLGTYLIGAGFVLIAWPWWFLPLFTFFFYLRFNRQVVKEEGYLRKSFGTEFDEYSRKVPRFVPSWSRLRNINLARVCPKEELFSTKEKRALFWWPGAVVLLDVIQEKIVYGRVDLMMICSVFIVAILFFTLSIWQRYNAE